MYDTYCAVTSSVEPPLMLHAVLKHVQPEYQFRDGHHRPIKCADPLHCSVQSTGLAAADRLPRCPDAHAEHNRHLVCPICCDIMVEPTSLQCGHSYCTTCLQMLSVSRVGPSYRCPECNQVVSKAASPDVNIVIRTFIGNTFPGLDVQRRCERSHRDWVETHYKRLGYADWGKIGRSRDDFLKEESGRYCGRRFGIWPDDKASWHKAFRHVLRRAGVVAEATQTLDALFGLLKVSDRVSIR